MTPFAAEQYHIARLQGGDAGFGDSRGPNPAGLNAAVGFRRVAVVSRNAAVFAGAGVLRYGSQHRNVPVIAQQGPHAVPFHAYLHVVALGEHRFDLLEKQTVREQHQRRVFEDSSPNTVRQANSAAAASGRHSR